MVLYAINSKIKELQDIPRTNRCLIGTRITNRQCKTSEVILERATALSSKKLILRKMHGADLIILTACFEKGIDIGAIPVLARYAKKTHALTIAFITTTMDDKDSQLKIEKAIQELYQYADTVMIINSKDKNMEETVRQGIIALYQLISIPSYINVDYADIKTVFEHKHNGFIAFGSGSGPTKLNDALHQVMQYIHIEKQLYERRSVIIQVRVCLDITLQDIEHLITLMNKTLGFEMDMILGVSFDYKLVDTIMITLLSASTS